MSIKVYIDEGQVRNCNLRTWILGSMVGRLKCLLNGLEAMSSDGVVTTRSLIEICSSSRSSVIQQPYTEQQSTTTRLSSNLNTSVCSLACHDSQESAPLTLVRVCWIAEQLDPVKPILA